MPTGLEPLQEETDRGKAAGVRTATGMVARASAGSANDRNGSGERQRDKPVVPQRSTVNSSAMTAEALLRGMRTGPVSVLSAGALPLQLLIVESDPHLLQPLIEVGQGMGFAIQGGTPAEVSAGLHALTCDVVLLDLSPEVARLNLLARLRQRFPRVPILVTTAFASVQAAVDALRHGASDFLTKPFSLEELTTTLQLVAEQRRFDLESRRVQHQVGASLAMQEMAAASPGMQKLLSMMTRVAPSAHPVLVLGESGSGKERVCRMLHKARMAALAASDPKAPDLPFLHLACSTTAAALAEAELFGFVRDEGTSLRHEKVGLLTAEEGGTLFLDEIDGLPLELQSKLLRALQDRSVRPAGSAMARPVTVRVLASSSRDLAALVERGAFRKDLYFKLNVVTLRVPALRQRREDLPLLAAVFLERHSRRRNLNFSLGPDAMQVLLGYDWPGNVRELEGAIERACSFSSGPVLHTIDLPTQLQQGVVQEEPLRIGSGAGSRTADATSPGRESTPVIEPIADMERRVILSTLDKLKGDKLMTAKLLGIGKTTLYRKLKEYGVSELAG